MKRFQDAVFPLERAIELQPDNVEARVNLACAYAHVKRRAEAILQMREVVRLQPTDVEAQFFLGTLYVLEKEKPQALAQYEAVKSLNRELAQKLYGAIYRGKVVMVAEKR
jgi:cytochrome c-type biogenesis protein CcmH/NrfG